MFITFVSGVPFTIPSANTAPYKHERVQILYLVMSCGYHTAARTPGRTRGLQDDCQNKIVYRNLAKGSEILLGNNNIHCITYFPLHVLYFVMNV
jgi:hypothetical protein